MVISLHLMSSLHERIQQVNAELNAIHAELAAAALPNADPQVRARVMDELLHEDALAALKNTVDNMRLLLWSYMEASSQHDPQSIARTLQSVRMQRVTEMLKNLEPGVDQQKMAQSPESVSFFDLINKIANRALEQHQKKSSR